MVALQATCPLTLGDVTLVPIVRTEILSDMGNAGWWITASKGVFAIVLCDANGVRALAVDSSEIALDSLIQETPNLGAILSGLSVS